ncbi:MAG: TPM domain-containing protein [Treponemataceae bacterium]|nr:TPM domain-containing protein [Spirochaetales bacterium]MDY6030231.1 TPM domain-containing protein [Treponemataceae bacterium]
MTIDRLKKKYGFTASNISKIQKAVSDAENGSEGEVVFAISPSSAFYTSWELVFAGIFSILSFVIMIPFSSRIEAFLKSLFWQSHSYFVPLFMLMVVLITFLVFFLIANISFVDRLIVPHRAMKSFVEKKALSQFVLSDICSTKKRTGILIFVSVLEHEVRIVCDKGILNATNQAEWDDIASELAKGFSEKDPTCSIVKAIERCGALFKANFPVSVDEPDENELSDGVVFVEGGEI